MQNLLINRFQSRQRSNIGSPLRQKPISPISAASVTSCTTSAKHSRNQSSKHSAPNIISNFSICDSEDQPATMHVSGIPKMPNLLNTKAKPITHIMSHQEELVKEHKKLKKQLHQEKVMNDQLTMEMDLLGNEKTQLVKTIERLNNLNIKREQEIRAKDKEFKEYKNLSQANIAQLHEQISALQNQHASITTKLTKQLERKNIQIKELTDSSKTISISLNVDTTEQLNSKLQQMVISAQLSKEYRYTEALMSLLQSRLAMEALLQKHFHSEQIIKDQQGEVFI